MTLNPTIRIRRPDGTPNARWRRHGMTIVELMVVIVILMILVATMMPSLVRVQILGKTTQTKATINTLSNACRAYQQEQDLQGSQVVLGQRVKDYPPDSTPVSGKQGRHRLVEAFYGPGDNGWQVKRGTLYNAQFFGVADLPVGVPTGESAKVFLDAFGQPIYYYGKRHNPGNLSQFINFAADNTGTGVPTSLGTYVKDHNPDIANANDVGDFLLISKGHDGKWQTETGAKKDDVVNFK